MRVNNRFLIFLVVFLMFISVSLPVFIYLQKIDYIPEQKIGGGATASVSVFIPAECGDGLCELDETCASCPGDCGICICGDGICDANETCLTCPDDCGVCPTSEGGDSGGRAYNLPNFEFDPWYFEEDLSPGESVLRTASVKNLGTYTNIKLFVKGLEDFISLNKNSFWLGKNDFDYFNFEISIPSNAEEGVLIGQIEGIAGSVTRYFPITLNIRALESVLRVYVTLPSERESFKPNEVINAEVSVVNLADPLFADFYFYISDLDGNEFDRDHEKIYLNSGTNMIPKELIIPSNLEPGYYLFFTETLYGGKVYMDARIFKVVSPDEIAGVPPEYADYAQVVLFFALLAMIIYFGRKYIRSSKRRNKICR